MRFPVMRDLVADRRPATAILRRSKVALAIVGGTQAIPGVVRAQRDPTQTPAPLQVQAVATSTPERVSVTTPTPTPLSIAVPPTSTPTPRIEERATDTPTVPPEPPPPSGDSPDMTGGEQAEPPGDTGQQIECPTPFDPSNWFCWPTDSGPWYPFVPSPSVSERFGVQWYGLRVSDPESTEWAMESGAWDYDGNKIGSLAISVQNDGVRWSADVGEADLAGSYSISEDSGEPKRIFGELAGQQYEVVLTDGELPASSGNFSLDSGQQHVLEFWSPAIAEAKGLLELASVSDGSIEGPGNCALGGFFAANFCIASFSYTLFTGNIVCDDIVEEFSSIC